LQRVLTLKRKEKYFASDLKHVAAVCGETMSDNLLKLTKTQLNTQHVLLQFVSVLHPRSI